MNQLRLKVTYFIPGAKMEVLFAYLAAMYGIRIASWTWTATGKISKPFGDAANSLLNSTGAALGEFVRGLNSKPPALTDVPADRHTRLQQLLAWRTENEAIIRGAIRRTDDLVEALEYLDQEFQAKVKELIDGQ